MPFPSARRLARLTVAVATSASLLAQAAASADSATYEDALDDVVELDYVGESGDRRYRPAPGRTEADVERMKLVHGPNRVRLVLHVVDVQRHARSIEAVLVTPRHRFTAYSLRLRDYGNQDGLLRDGDDRRCRGMRAGIDPETDRGFLSIPRRCLGDPRWVRIGAEYDDTETLDPEEESPLYVDDPLRDGSIGNNPKLSKRLHRD